MANSAQARKRARQAAKANSHNSALRSKFRTAIKAVRKAIDAGDKAASLQPSRVCKRPQRSNSGRPASAGYLLFPLHGKARLGGLFCLEPVRPNGPSHPPMPVLRP
jgi:Ribosomal protein S20